MINDIPPEHRLSQSNPTFRGYAWVPEGQHVRTAILNQPDGSLIQDLPFSIELNKFIVDYYSTGMPKLFASDIVVVDHKTGARVPARVEVNKPFTYDGVSIYQSSFQDGGSQMQMTAYPMTGASAKTVAVRRHDRRQRAVEHGYTAGRRANRRVHGFPRDQRRKHPERQRPDRRPRRRPRTAR